MYHLLSYGQIGRGTRGPIRRPSLPRAVSEEGLGSSRISFRYTSYDRCYECLKLRNRRRERPASHPPRPSIFPHRLCSRKRPCWPRRKIRREYYPSYGRPLYSFTYAFTVDARVSYRRGLPPYRTRSLSRWRWGPYDLSRSRREV